MFRLTALPIVFALSCVAVVGCRSVDSLMYRFEPQGGFPSIAKLRRDAVRDEPPARMKQLVYRLADEQGELHAVQLSETTETPSVSVTKQTRSPGAANSLPALAGPSALPAGGENNRKSETDRIVAVSETLSSARPESAVPESAFEPSDLPLLKAAPGTLIPPHPAATPLLTAEPQSDVLQSDVRQMPIDLPTALRLVGGNNWSVQLAAERVREAQANVTAAEALWLPNLNVAVAYTKHDGQIQATDGQILDISRNSWFVGGGAKASDAPMTGGSGGPARMFVDLSLADALFTPLAARQRLCANQYNQSVVFNDTQLAVGLAYYDLVAAQGQLAVVGQNLADAEALLNVTRAFVAAGKGAESETTRVSVIAASRQQAIIEAELQLHLASNELSRLVRLNTQAGSGSVVLYSAEDALTSVNFVPDFDSLDALIAQGQSVRPEVGEEYSRARALQTEANAECARPWLPNVHLGLSGGFFGGGTNDTVNGLDGRSDADALLVWEMRNLGVGTVAAQAQRHSQYRQSVLRTHQLQDQIAAEVTAAWHRVQAARKRMPIAQRNLVEASELYEQNRARIRGLEGQPIEAIQALDALANARISQLATVISYNQAQMQLLRAIGRPASAGI